MTEKTWKIWLKSHHGRDIIEPLKYLEAAPWNPNANDRDAAWTFYNELRTRVSHTPLRYRDGDEVAALKSLHEMFQITRVIIDKHGPQARHFAILARTTLDRFIRPVTSRWHRQQLAGRLDKQDHRRLFRRDLGRLQKSLADLVHVFGELAEGDKYVPEPESPTDANASMAFNSDRVWPMEFLGPKKTATQSVKLNDILHGEIEKIVERRKLVYGKGKEYEGLGKASNADDSMGLFGLAISGGGIRSATFALGVLQQLTKQRILRDVDYLSTVSGGGYMGAFMSSHLLGSDHDHRTLLVPDRGLAETDEVRWLRNRSKSLKGGGVLRTLIGLFGNLALYLGPALLVSAAIPLAAAQLQVPYLGWITVCTIAGLGLYLTFFADVNRLSLHRLYRRRLAETYIKRPEGHESPKCSNLHNTKKAPYHLICAAVNLPASKDLELRGRRSDFFVFSELYCGSILTGYRPTEELENCDPDLDLATAMAISGAALSTHAGTLPQWRIFRPILMLLRLSYWMPNPRRSIPPRKWRRPGLFHLILEAFGRFDEGNRYINVSDGGHIENLGIYELLRRRCKLIVCIDGEHDPEQSCSGLIKACRFASIDMGIQIDIDLSELKAADDGLCQAHFAVGTINYNRRDSGALEVGYLLYLKLSMTGNERDYVREYRGRHPSFPHETTADQFYDEDQFEAYRALGHHVAADLFDEELIGKLTDEKNRTRQWFEALANALEPPSPNESKG